MTTIHLDRELSKQELQMENRRLRNHLKRLWELATAVDLRLGATDQALHLECDALLAEINRTVASGEVGTDDKG